MEYNLDSVAPPQKLNPLKRFFNFVTSPQYSRTFSVLVVLLIAAAIPLTAYFAQQQTRSRQQAADNPNGKVEFVDVSGNPLPSTISDPNVYLKVTKPDNWLPATGQLQNPNQNVSVIKKAYSQAACPGVCRFKSESKSGCTYFSTGDGACQASNPPQGTVSECDSDNNCQDVPNTSHCYTGCGQAPTPTRIPTSQPSAPTPTPTPIPDSGQLQAPVPDFPRDGQTVASGPITISWSNVSGAVSYNIGVQDLTNPQARHPAAEFSNNCPDNPFYICTNGWQGNSLNIIVEPGHGYRWWVHAAKDRNDISHGPPIFTANFGVSSNTPPPTQPPPGGGTKTLERVNIANVDSDGSTGGRDPFSGSGSGLASLISQPIYWKLNDLKSDQNSATRTVHVGFTAQDGTNKTASATITLTRGTGGGGQPAATATPIAACTKTPQEVGSNIIPDMPIEEQNRRYQWVEVGAKGKPGEGQPVSSCNNTNSFCIFPPGATTDAEKHSQCPQNTSQPDNIRPETSNWCYADHCLQLRYIGGTQGPAPTQQQGPPFTPVTPAQPTPAGQPTATPIPGQQPTVTPTVTPIPTPTSSITPPPPGPASVTYSVTLSGIGQRGATRTSQAKNNPDPVQTRRDATLFLYAPGDDPIGDSTGARAKYVVPQPQALVYDGNNKFVAANFNLGSTFVPGQYQVLIKTPRYLRKRIPGVQTINAGANTISQQAALPLGDANNDNKLNSLDYQEYRSCLNQQTTSCMVKADFNDDGKVDTVTPVPDFSDHALFTSQFAIIEGD